MRFDKKTCIRGQENNIFYVLMKKRPINSYVN